MSRRRGGGRERHGGAGAAAAGVAGGGRRPAVADTLPAGARGTGGCEAQETGAAPYAGGGGCSGARKGGGRVRRQGPRRTRGGGGPGADSPERRICPAPVTGAAVITPAHGAGPVPTDGGCTICGQTMTLRRMRGHLLGHFKEGAGGREGPAGACLVRITGYSPIRHWLYVRIGPRATLRTLDALLRDVWVDCCGHLSSFSTDETSYESSVGDPDMGYDDRETETMDVGAADVLSEYGSLRYEYDYGTTTELFVSMACECPSAG